MIQTVVGHASVVVGTLLLGIAALGVVRLPDVYTRTSAVAKAAGLGLVLVLLGVAVLVPGWGPVLVLLVAVALQLFTVPIGGFEIGQAARVARAPVTDRTVHDDAELPRLDDLR
ncbi:monovalent cation/H(+) antiporter subunit G [Kineococcus terrestris]|uniref:monovalent cation/H(+) antiporter subunit G n=1 Tax=Kineococcus terrestris TaxID=2044856 RepID=UPI0034DABAF7